MVYELNPPKYCENKIYFFDDNLSSFRIMNVYLDREEVHIQFNIRGRRIDDTLALSKSRIFYINDKKQGYSFILKAISREKRCAEIVIAKIK